MSQSQPTWATVKQVCAVVRQHPRTIQRQCIAGNIVCRRSPGGGQWLIQVDEEGWPLVA